jgi:hypothetical protein
MKYIKKWLIVFIAFLLLIPLGLNGNVISSTIATEKMFDVRVDIVSPSQVKEIETSGIKILEKYPAYMIGKATSSQLDKLVEEKLLAVKLPDQNRLYINGRIIYPKGDDSKTFIMDDPPVGFRQSDIIQKDTKYYLVKFVTQAQNEWIQELKFKGVELVEYFHENAYVLRTNQKQIEEIKAYSYVTAVTEFLPSFKMYPGYTIEDGYQFVYVTLWKGTFLDIVTQDIKEFAKGVVLANLALQDFSIATVLLPIVNIKDLARIPDIAYIELPPDRIELKLDQARKIVGMHYIDQEGLYNATLNPTGKGRLPITLDGAGQVVAVMDSGLDNGGGTSLGVNFRGRVSRAYNYVGTRVAKMGAFPYSASAGTSILNPYAPPMKDQFWFGFDYGATRVVWTAPGPGNSPSWADQWGHGTHVTGIIASSGTVDNRYKGVAPGATIVVQKITPPWRWEDTTRALILSPQSPTSLPYPNMNPWPLRWPAKYHTQITTHTLWDFAPPPGGAEDPITYNWTNEVPYKQNVPPGSNPGQQEKTTYHDVPVVSGEVYGPRIHPISWADASRYFPEEGSTNPLAGYWEGVAGTMNYAMTDAYVNDRARVMNNSWWFYFIRAAQDYTVDPGSSIFNTYDYNAISRIVDNFQYYQQDFLTVWAAGDNGRDRDLNGITDDALDLNKDEFFGNPRVQGENQQFFAPAALKNGITVGATENYRYNTPDEDPSGVTVNLFYGKTGSNTTATPRANFGMFGNNVGTLTSVGTVTDVELPNWGDVIAADKIADGNAPIPLFTEYPFTTAHRTIIERGYPDSVEGRKFNPVARGKFAMAAFSTRGPTSDGRIKPDLVAPGTMVISDLAQYLQTNTSGRGSNRYEYPFEKGYIAPATLLPPSAFAYMSGTSVSAAFVSGAALVTRQFYTRIKNLTVSPMPTGALVKATLIHGAVNMAQTGFPNQYDQIVEGGRVDETYNDTQKIADGSQGWGRLNVYNSLFPIAPRIQKFDDNTTGVDAEVITYKVNIDNTDVPFEATLCWTDEAGSPNTWPILKHNLDLVVIDPAGLIYRGNQFGTPPTQDPNVSVPMATSTDTLNNVERIVISEPKMKGEYKISVVPSSLPKAPGGPVKYALVYSGGFSDLPLEQPIPAMNPLVLSLMAAVLLFVGLYGIRKGMKQYSKS